MHLFAYEEGEALLSDAMGEVLEVDSRGRLRNVLIQQEGLAASLFHEQQMTLILSCVPLDTVLEGAEGLEGARCGVKSGESVPDLYILIEAQQDLLELGEVALRELRSEPSQILCLLLLLELALQDDHLPVYGFQVEALSRVAGRDHALTSAGSGSGLAAELRVAPDRLFGVHGCQEELFVVCHGLLEET